ncbi:MAG TPA: hypothetical protein VHT73_12440 [Thermodesulfobacteriota bacterium]|nr:hypothetical protein [Thermodesulfobacteriota bacterium]
MKRYLFSLFLPAALVLVLSFGQIAQAINASQRDCSFSSRGFNSTSYIVDPDISVSVNNGTSTRNCILTYSSEVGATPGDQVSVAYKVDGVACTVNGPEYFHIGNTSSQFETHTNVTVRTLGPGAHTIIPCLRFNDLGGGGNGTVIFRCMTVECRTN